MQVFTCRAQMMEPDTGGMSSAVLIWYAELLAYCTCQQHITVQHLNYTTSCTLNF